MKTMDRERKDKQNNVDKQNGNIAIIVLCIILTIVILPIVIVSGYSFFHLDDFYHANAVGVFGGNILELFVAALKYSKRMYLVWQGTYTSMFLQAFLSPLNGLGIVQLRIVMVLNSILFMISLWAFIDSLCKVCRISLKSELCICVLSFIGILGFSSWTEVFYWFSGAVSYSFPLSFGLWGIAIVLRSKDAKGYILASVLMFLSAGGTLAVAGTGCWILLIVCVVKLMNKRLKNRDCIVFAIAVIGALLNTAAPGNYIRHSQIDNTGLNLKLAFSSTIIEVIYSIEDLLNNTPFWIIVVLALFIGVAISRKKATINKKVLFVVAILSSITPFVTCFPVCLAYSGREYFPNRCKFVEMVIIVNTLLIVAMVVGYLFNEIFESFVKREWLVLVFMILIIMPNINSSWKISQNVPFKMWELLLNNSYQKYYDEVNKIYRFIENDTNQDVFVYKKPDPVDNFPSIDISEDMSNGMNKAIALYYGKKSVQFVSEPVCVQPDGQKNIRVFPDMFENKSEYVSIFKTDNLTQQTEVIQVLQPLDNNIIISVPQDESGTIGIYLFADCEAKTQIDAMEIIY